MKKRKICFVITSEIHYARSRRILEMLRRKRNVDLQIVVGASALLDYYGNVLKLLERDGFPVHAKIIMTLQGGSPVAMAKTTGIGVTEFATAFDNLQPDVVVVRGDRYEVLSAAIAASYVNIPVAHIEGGDVTGTIDESVRHAVTKLSHIHFPTNELSYGRIIRMGEKPEYVFDVGAPEVEFIAEKRFRPRGSLINKLGVGDFIDIKKPYLMVMHHPVTSEFERSRKHVEEVLYAVHKLRTPTIWFWPNADAGTDDTAKGMRAFREKYDPARIRFIKYLPPEEFLGLLKNVACLVGNSSTGVKECSYWGVPAVNIGTRQQGRLRGDNVFDVGYDRRAIARAIKKQIGRGRYASSDIYYKPGTNKRIADTLAVVPLYTQKQFFD